MPHATFDRPTSRATDPPPPPVEPPEDDDGKGDGRAWVTAATYWQPMDAQMARIRLESEGIACMLLDENLVAMQWLYANAVGGIKLQVPAGELTRARKALAGDDQADVLPYESGEDLRAIAMFHDAGEAQLAASALEGREIRAHVRADAAPWDDADDFERFSLVVDGSDVAIAIEFLRTTPARTKLIDVSDGDAHAIDNEPAVPHCPACNSLNVRRRFATRRSAALAILLLGFPIPFVSRQWTCDACGHDWQ